MVIYMRKKKMFLLKIAACFMIAALLVSVCLRIAGWNRGRAIGGLSGKFTEEPTGGPAEESVSAGGEVAVTYPDYTEEAVSEGHLTWGFDLKIVLLGFRDKLDNGDYGTDIRLNKEAGFALWQDTENRDIYAVMEGKDGKEYAIVTVGDAGIDKFPTLRQVHSFRIVAAEELDSFTDNWTAYGAFPGQGEETEPLDIDGDSSAISAGEGETFLYCANDKGNRILLEGEDKASVESVFGKVSFSEDISVGLLRYVVKTDDCKYMFDWEGVGIKDVYDDGTTLLKFRLSQEELAVLTKLCEKYGIYETAAQP